MILYLALNSVDLGNPKYNEFQSCYDLGIPESGIIMKAITENKSGMMSTKRIIIISTLSVLLIALVVLIALYGFKEPAGMFDDEEIDGEMAMGTVFTYEIDIDGTVTSVDVEIIGESGSYYLLDVSEILTVVTGGSSEGYMMIHKETGELRFAEEGDEQTIEFDDEEITLIKWSVDDEDGCTWMFASCEDDGIPYVIECIFGDEVLEFQFTDVEIVEPEGQFERPSELDEYYFYDVEGTVEGREAVGKMYFHVVADCGDGKFAFVQIFEGTYTNDDGTEEDEFTIGYEIQSMTLLEFLTASLAGGTLAEPETLSTIDGDVECDVYELAAFGLTAYLGEENGIIYRVDFALPTEYGWTLFDYSAPEA